MSFVCVVSVVFGGVGDDLLLIFVFVFLCDVFRRDVSTLCGLVDCRCRGAVLCSQACLIDSFLVCVFLC